MRLLLTHVLSHHDESPAWSRGAIMALVVLSLMLLAPTCATVGAQELASPAASPRSKQQNAGHRPVRRGGR